MSGFFESVKKARVLLEEHSRVSLRGLRRELSVDDETLEDLVEELVEGCQVARRDGASLVWRGESAAPKREAPTQLSTQAAADTGERRQLTVMFCDLVGSTELAERVDPEELRNILHKYRAICVEAAKRFDGHVAQFLGDGVLVYFGYPRAHEDAAGRAIRSALEIQRMLGEHPEEVRLGIHTGPVVVDPAGQGDDALALGPTINLASRIQGIAKPGTVVVSEATLSLSRSLFVTASLGETQVKGFEEPILIHEVERAVGIRSALETDTAGPMLGRDPEVGLLIDRWEDVQESRGQVLLVTGEPGMGKSRLVRAFRDTLGDAQHLWFDMRCSPYASGSAFQPIVDLLQSGLGFGGTDAPLESSEQLVRVLESLPGLSCDQVVPYLLPLLSLPPSERYVLPQTSAEEQRERTLAALLRLNVALSEQQPVVLVVEDVHWSDPSTLEYLGRLVEQAGSTRMVLILTFRPEFLAPWTQSYVSQIKLDRLSKRVTREMIEKTAGRVLPEAVVAELESRSDGVPLFIEELVAGLLSSGVIEEETGRDKWRGDTKDLAIPATLQDSLMARLDRLGASKRVAQQAATLGREFSFELIAAVSDLDPAALSHALEQLVSSQILHRRSSPPDVSYTFRHALLQDTAYESQLLSTRKTLHARVAAVLEERFAKRAESEPELMARHCAAAGLHEGAVGHYLRAAELANARLSNEEASEYFSQALDALALLPEGDERNQQEIGIRVGHGQALIALLGCEAPEVLSTFARVDELRDAMGEGPQQIPALIGLVQYDVQRGDPLSASDRAELLLEIAEPLGLSELLVVGHAMIGSALLNYASAAEAEARLRRALDVAKTVDFPGPARPYDSDILSLAHAAHMVALAASAKPDQAVEALRPLRERLRQIDHDCSRTSALALVSNAGFVAYDVELCRSAAEESLEIAQGRGFHINELIALILRGWARAHQGELAAAVDDVERGLALETSSGSVVGGGYYHVAAAEVHRLAKNRERAAELLDLAEPLCDAHPIGGPGLSFVRGQLCLDLGDNGLLEAEGHFQAALEKAAAMDLRWEELYYATHLARLAPRMGNVREAHDRLAQLYAGLTEGFDRPTAREAKAVLGELSALLPEP